MMTLRTVRFPEDFPIGSFAVSYCDESLVPPFLGDLLDVDIYQAENRCARALNLSDDDIPYAGPAQGDVFVPPGFCLTLTLDCSELRNYEALARLGPHDVQVLYLHHQEILSEGFPYSGYLSGLRKIELGSSTVRDADMRIVGTLTDLEWGELSATWVTDTGIAELGQLAKLRGLNLSFTRVTGQSFAHLTHLDQLVYLNLYHTLVNDHAMGFVARLSGLVSLSLDSTRITDVGVTTIREMTWLRQLGLSGTAITDDAVRAIQSLTELRVLGLGQTAITDAIVPVLAAMRQLRFLGIAGTRIPYAGYRTLRDALPLCSIDWTPPVWEPYPERKNRS